MLVDSINLNHIRIFESVFRSRSMTKAAEDLHMTQSGVSQHIKHLEEILGVVLFDRVKQRLIPTDKATNFYRTAKESLDNIEQALTGIKGVEQKLTGTLTIGVPVEFGNAFILPLLAQFGILHPEINFRIRYGFASMMNPVLMDGQLDFAIIDRYQMDRHIQTLEIYTETLHLVGSEEYLLRSPLKGSEKNYLLNASFVDYLDNEPVLRMWFEHHFKNPGLRLNVRAHVMDVQGLDRFITNGLGLGILPLYHIEKLRKLGHKLHLFREQSPPLQNTISVAYVSERTLSSAANQLISFLTKKLTS